MVSAASERPEQSDVPKAQEPKAEENTAANADEQQEETPAATTEEEPATEA